MIKKVREIRKNRGEEVGVAIGEEVAEVRGVDVRCAEARGIRENKGWGNEEESRRSGEK